MKQKEIRICDYCKGTKKFEDGSSCTVCDGLGEHEDITYTCKCCDYSYIIYGFEKCKLANPQCQKCYADIETGKYSYPFFYVSGKSLTIISRKITKLLEKGYTTHGNPFVLYEDYVSQAVIKKELK